MKEIKQVRIYIDGGSRGNPGNGACASVIMDAKGEIIAQEGRFLGKCTNNFAEYSALHLAISVSKKIGASVLDIFSDSELLVKQFNGEYRIKDEKLKDFMLIIRKEIKNFREIRITHIRREKNKIADKLVNNILDSKKMPDEENRKIALEREEKFKQSELF